MKIYLSDYALDYIEDQVSYPHLTLELSSTGVMNTLMDEVRIGQNLPPFFDDTYENYISDGWYDFYAVINLETEESCGNYNNSSLSNVEFFYFL